MKTIKDAGSKYDVYSISPKIRQILLDWGYELTERDFFLLIFQTSMQKMSYYQFNRLEILQRATTKKKKHSKEKAKEYYAQKKKTEIKEYQKKIYQQLVQYQKEAFEKIIKFCFFSI